MVEFFSCKEKYGLSITEEERQIIAKEINNKLKN